MQPLKSEEFSRETDAFDAAVDRTPGLDPFCSGADWILACRAFGEEGLAPSFWRGAGGYAALSATVPPRALIGCDTTWGFACPFVGPEAGREFLRDGPRDWQILAIPGVGAGSPLLAELAQESEVRLGAVLRRARASLQGGPSRFLERRPRGLRRELVRAERTAARAGITFEAGEGGGEETVLARILDVEQRSWKGPAREGLLIPSMEAFYRVLVRRLLERGRLRARFARWRGEDVGYILGGVRAGIYRGLQFSYDERFARHSLGHWMQWRQICEACGEGLALYDLGGAMEYKRAWGESPLDTATLLVRRGAGTM